MLVKQARERSEEMRKVNALLRSADPDWEAVTVGVDRVNDTVTGTTPTEERRLEPYLVDAVSRAMLRLWPAVAGRDRRGARMAAEQVRQALVDSADAAEREGARDPKQTARWVADVVEELDEDAVGTLFGVSQRTWQRWVAPAGTSPSTDAAVRLRTVAAALDHLRRAYTAAGAVAWFDRPHPQIGGQRPAELLDDPTQHRTVVDVAAGARVSIAA